MRADGIMLSAEALTCLVFAVPFWWGAALALYDLVETHVPAGASVTHGNFALALSLLIVGLLYALFALDLDRRTERIAFPGPRRALTLALLAAGTLTTTASVAATFYILASNLLLRPAASWKHSARTALVILIVGASLAGLYAWRGTREGAFSGLGRHREPGSTAEGVTAAPKDEITAVLDEFAAGALSREEAASRLRLLIQPKR